MFKEQFKRNLSLNKSVKRYKKGSQRTAFFILKNYNSRHLKSTYPIKYEFYNVVFIKNYLSRHC